MDNCDDQIPNHEFVFKFDDEDHHSLEFSPDADWNWMDDADCSPEIDFSK